MYLKACILFYTVIDNNEDIKSEISLYCDALFMLY